VNQICKVVIFCGVPKCRSSDKGLTDEQRFEARPKITSLLLLFTFYVLFMEQINQPASFSPADRFAP